MNDPPVLYQRAKASDMLQGMSDMIDIMELEIQKFQRWHSQAYGIVQYNGVSTLFSQIQQLRNYSFNVNQAVQMLREKGL